MATAQVTALADFSTALAGATPISHEALAALDKIRRELRQVQRFLASDQPAVRGQLRQVEEELAQRLLTHFAGSEYANNYLVRGVRLLTDLDGEWSAEYPSYEVDLETEELGRQLVLHVPSAFHLFVEGGDWQGAKEIIDRCPAAFTSPGLRGWRAAVLASCDSSRAVELFHQAADSFAEDRCPDDEELVIRGGSWSGINVQLRAKYFRARARLLEGIRYPERVKEFLTRAEADLEGTEAGWANGQVSRFRILVGTLAKLVTDPTTLNADAAAKEYSRETEYAEEGFDQYALRFIREAGEAFHGFAVNPGRELTRNRLASAVEALARVPLIGPEFVTVVEPVLGDVALQEVFGPIRTWIHRTLESITDEAKFRDVLLRLLQAGLPLYAQVCHGPVEYGKDIVALVQDGTSTVLRLYQVKCGTIDKRKWREGKDELEEMFLVEVASLHLPVRPDRIEGFLVSNGHANKFVEPVMHSWFREQRDTHARNIDFLHLDRLVDWIVSDRLINELRLALSENDLGILSIR